ncbi:hypothetical protein EWM64_g3635 [Hericium alpestre]|uniref:Ubiquitin-like protease family profile domain-containing protein n=1 Tax=Hericium alpestre TaxID=135208 RepID=A0A4Z0A244_9AGAM|nr:hypothetical protein EWM64_g3635 [Hericium alpestre]
MANAGRQPKARKAKSPSVAQMSQEEGEAKKAMDAKEKAEKNARRRQLYQQKKKMQAQQPKTFNFITVSEQQMDLRVQQYEQRVAHAASGHLQALHVSLQVSAVDAADSVSHSCPSSGTCTPAADIDGYYYHPAMYISYDPDAHGIPLPISTTSSLRTISWYWCNLTHFLLPKHAVFCTDPGLEDLIMVWLSQVQAWLVQFDVINLWDRPNVDDTVLVLQQCAIQSVKHSLSFPSGGYTLAIKEVDSADMIMFSIKAEVNHWRDERPKSVECVLIQMLDARLSESDSTFGVFIRVGRCHRQDIEQLRPGVLLSGDLISYFVQKWNFIYSDSLILNTDFMETHLPYVPPPSYCQKVIRYDGLRVVTKTGVIPWHRIIIPIHLRSKLHWVLARLIWLVEYLFGIAQAMGYRYMKNYWGSWVFHPHALCPWQSNSSDCGVFVLVFTMHVLHGGIPSDTVPASFLLTFNDKPRELPGVRLHLLQELMHDYDTECNGLPLWHGAETKHGKAQAPVVPLSKKEPSPSHPSGVDVIVLSDSKDKKEEGKDHVIEISDSEEEKEQAHPDTMEIE